MRQLEHHEVKTSGRRHPISLCCPDWQDPRNVGAAFRLADAAGLERIILAGETPQPPNRKIDKTARSTVRSVPYHYTKNTISFLAAAVSEGAYLLALELTDQSVSLFDYRLPPEVASGEQPVILVPGGEAAGVPPEVLALCHHSVHLPMHGRNTSMNVAVATGAAVYLLLAQLTNDPTQGR